MGRREHVCDVDGWKWGGSVSRCVWLPFESLLFFCYKLFPDILRDIIMALQCVTLLGKVDESFKMRCP